MSYIPAEEFLKQSEKVQRELLEWWQPQIGDLTTSKYPMEISFVKSQRDIEALKYYKGKPFLPLLQIHQLIKFLEDKINCKVECYVDYIGYTIHLEIIEKINIAMLALQNGNIQLKTLAIEKAKTKKEYYIELNKKILELKADKYPATLIQDLAKGDSKVAELRLNKDIAESSYYVAIDALNNLRLEIETLRSMLTWLRTELKNS
ncbi:hypothetical protein [Clostridium sp. Marseille-QA1073]